MFVFPTRVGVFPTAEDEVILKNGLPHPRGGVSPAGQRYGTRLRSSPPAWGCFFLGPENLPRPWVFPTRVGVFHQQGNGTAQDLGLPHPRGGVSIKKSEITPGKKSSPPAWGCFLRPMPSVGIPAVFPTRVGVFPASRLSVPTTFRLPHRCGVFSLFLPLHLLMPDAYFNRNLKFLCKRHPSIPSRSPFLPIHASGGSLPPDCRSRPSSISGPQASPNPTSSTASHPSSPPFTSSLPLPQNPGVTAKAKDPPCLPTCRFSLCFSAPM